jgi:hypothetical protein
LDLRRLGLLSIVVLIAQMLLGVAVNLWVTIGTDRPWTHIGHVALFAAHGLLGLAVLLLAFLVLAKGFEGSSRPEKASAATAFVGVVGALCCGVGFVSSGGAAGFSFGMAVGWAVALAANVWLVLSSADLSQLASPSSKQAS